MINFFCTDKSEIKQCKDSAAMWVPLEETGFGLPVMHIRKILPALTVFDIFGWLWEHLAGFKNLKKCWKSWEYLKLLSRVTQVIT